MSTLAPYRPLLTVREAAARLRVSEKTVRRLVAAAELPALKVGGQIRVDEGELEAWLYGPGAVTVRPLGLAERGAPVEGQSTAPAPRGSRETA